MSRIHHSYSVSGMFIFAEDLIICFLGYRTLPTEFSRRLLSSFRKVSGKKKHYAVETCLTLVTPTMQQDFIKFVKIRKNY